MRLFIAEKPSLARSIAAVLSNPQQNHKLYIQAGDDIVAWAAGHLLEQAMPETYDDKYKHWNIADLPIFPDVWKLLVKKESKDLFDNLKKLLKQADVVVNAGDCDREGQLLIDEILEYCGYKGKVLRILISDTNPEAVKKALDNLKPDSDFHGDRDAALARSRADWLHGMNLTRLYTKMAERNGYNGGPLRIGRVKTPVTALVVRRDEAIEAFTPKPFWVVKARISVHHGSFFATWKPHDEQDGLDEDKRLIDKSVGEAIVTRLKGKPATIIKYESKKQSSKPPVGFSLPKLQMIASKKFDLSPAKVLDICQKLYELGILTYPRSDCEYLPDAHHDEADNVFRVIETLSSLKIPSQTDKCRKTPVFNSKKVEEHHAIIPSASCKITKPLEGDEALIFELVARSLDVTSPFSCLIMNFCRSTSTLTLTANSLLRRGGKFSMMAGKLLNMILRTTMTRIITTRIATPLLCLKLQRAKMPRATIFSCWKSKLRLRLDSLRLLCSKL